jgi:predicted ATP-grasp superfamily ATP-dependent carboligase
MKLHFGDLQLLEFQGINCDGAIILECVPVDEEFSLNTITGQFFIDQLKLPLVAEVSSSVSVPICIIEKGCASKSIRFYGNQKVVVIQSEFPLEEDLQHSMIDLIFDFQQRWNCSTIISIRGLSEEPNIKGNSGLTRKALEKSEEFAKKGLTDDAAAGDDDDDSEGGGGDGDDELQPPQSKEELLKMLEDAKKRRGDEKLWFCTNNLEFSEKLMKAGHKPISDVILTGVSAGIISASSYMVRSEVPICCCLFSKLAELQKFIAVDVRASLALVSAISMSIMDEKLDTTELLKDITKVENEMERIIKRLAPPASKSASSMYM